MRLRDTIIYTWLALTRWRVGNYIIHKTSGVITYPRPSHNKAMSVKWVQGNMNHKHCIHRQYCVLCGTTTQTKISVILLEHEFCIGRTHRSMRDYIIFLQYKQLKIMFIRDGTLCSLTPLQRTLHLMGHWHLCAMRTQNKAGKTYDRPTCIKHNTQSFNMGWDKVIAQQIAMYTTVAI